MDNITKIDLKLENVRFSKEGLLERAFINFLKQKAFLDLLDKFEVGFISKKEFMNKIKSDNYVIDISKNTSSENIQEIFKIMQELPKDLIEHLSKDDVSMIFGIEFEVNNDK